MVDTHISKQVRLAAVRAVEVVVADLPPRAASEVARWIRVNTVNSSLVELVAHTLVNGWRAEIVPLNASGDEHDLAAQVDQAYTAALATAGWKPPHEKPSVVGSA